MVNEANKTPEVADGRDEKGRFVPGVSGNPGGKPKHKHITSAYKEILERDGAEVYAQIVADDAKTAKKPSDRLAAVQEMTDRTEGRAIQAHVIGMGEIDPETAKRLAELAEMLLPKEETKTTETPKP